MSPHDSHTGEIAVVTGASSGIGLETAKELATIGYEVAMVCRDTQRAAGARAAVAAVATGPTPGVFMADLTSQQQIRSLAEVLHERYDHIDVLINNAGASFSSRDVTVDGIERTFALNHLAPFLLTQLLVDLLTRASAGRVIVVSSETHSRKLDFDNVQGERRYNFFAAYTRSKLANILFAYELARRLERTPVTVNALSPGPTRSHFGDNMTGFPLFFSRMMKRTPLFKSPQQAAQTSVYLATSHEVAGVTGRFFMHSQERKSKPITHDLEVAAKLWAVSEQLTASDRVVSRAVVQPPRNVGRTAPLPGRRRPS